MPRKDTPAEGMPAVQHVSEADDHFVVTFADGKSTVVHKEGLKADTLAHIQGMAHGGEAHALTGGGVHVGSEGMGEEWTGAGLTNAKDGPQPHVFVPRMRPATVPSDEDVRTQREAETPEKPIRMADGGAVPDAGFQQPQFPVLDFMGGTDAGVPGVSREPANLGFTPMPVEAPPLFQNVSPGAEQATRALDVGSPYGLPSSSALGPAPDRGMVDLRAAPRPAAPPPPPPPPSGLPAFPSGSGALTELNKGLAEQRAGLAAQVEVEKQRDAALMQLQDRHIAEMQAMEAQHAEQAALHQRRADDLFQATLNAKVDPNRVWATADIGQRVAAGIGILLSGIGSGLGGGPNMALQVIDRTIDRDIDAQKTNLEHQKGLLSYYLQQGRDMMSAHALAKADLKDMLAAQVTRVSAEFGGQEAAARAQMVGGQLRTEAAGKRQEIMARDFQMKAQRMALGMEMEKGRLMSQFAAMGKAGQAGMVELMPKDARERTVKRPDGSIGIAADDTAAKKYREASQATDKMRRTLQRYRAVLDSGHPWIPSGAGGDQQTAKALRAELILNLKDMNTLGALQPGELALIEPMVPDITDSFTRDKTLNQGMDALGHTIEDRVNSNLQAFLE